MELGPGHVPSWGLWLLPELCLGHKVPWGGWLEQEGGSEEGLEAVNHPPFLQPDSPRDPVPSPFIWKVKKGLL